MQTHPAAINNSATPQALRQYIPDHLLDTSKRDHYEIRHILSEIMVRGVDLTIETHPADKSRAPTIRVQAAHAQHFTPAIARELALALLQLADVQEELAYEQSRAAAHRTSNSPFSDEQQLAAGLVVECFGPESPEALRFTRHIVARRGLPWLTEPASRTNQDALA